MSEAYACGTAKRSRYVTKDMPCVEVYFGNARFCVKLDWRQGLRGLGFWLRATYLQSNPHMLGLRQERQHLSRCFQSSHHCSKYPLYESPWLPVKGAMLAKIIFFWHMVLEKLIQTRAEFWHQSRSNLDIGWDKMSLDNFCVCLNYHNTCSLIKLQIKLIS